MKKVILLLTVIIGALLCQSCFCEHDLFGPDYHSYGHYYSRPAPPPHHGGHHGW